MGFIHLPTNIPEHLLGSSVVPRLRIRAFLVYFFKRFY